MGEKTSIKLAEARRVLANHQTADRPGRCFYFRDPKMGSHFAHSLTWSPGTLTLAGDIGELTITHYHALRSLEGALSWAATSDHHYLLSKTSRRPSYDRDATVKEILRQANERAGEALKYQRSELRAWRAERPKREDFEPTLAGERGWHEESAAWINDAPRSLAEDFRKRTTGHPSRIGQWDVPDGWELWHQIHQSFGSFDPTDVLKASERKSIRQELQNRLEDGGAERAGELCSELGMDDYYGEYEWTFQDVLQVEAIRIGAQKALKWLEGERVYCWHDVLPPLAGVA